MTTDPPRFAIVDTAFGAFGVAWGDAGILDTWLHARTTERTRALVRRAYPAAVETVPTDEIAAVLREVVALLEGALLEGAPRSLSGARLDMRAIPEFDRRVYEAVREIPPGETRTYGAIAKALGEEPMVARDVGAALSRNRFAPIVPCHRVVAANGSLGGFSAPGGTTTKRRMLELEGAAVVAPGPVQPGLFD